MLWSFFRYLKSTELLSTAFGFIYLLLLLLIWWQPCQHMMPSSSQRVEIDSWIFSEPSSADNSGPSTCNFLLRKIKFFVVQQICRKIIPFPLGVDSATPLGVTVPPLLHPLHRAIQTLSFALAFSLGFFLWFNLLVKPIQVPKAHSPCCMLILIPFQILLSFLLEVCCWFLQQLACCISDHLMLCIICAFHIGIFPSFKPVFSC